MNRQTLVVGLVATILVAGLPLSLPAAEPAISLWSESLSRRLDPPRIPFVARYRRGDLALDFVAVNHSFTLQNKNTEAISKTFEQLRPAIVVIEGFPTLMGISPEPIKTAARMRMFPDADAYARSESAYAAGLAMQRDIPFIGGEPTDKETLQHLVTKGYSKDEVALAFLSRELSQSLRAKTWLLGDESAFSVVFEQVRAVYTRTFGDGLMTLSQYRGWYRAYFYIDPVSDPRLAMQFAPDSATRIGQLFGDSMRYRDQHIAGVIAELLGSHRRVLVVYGRSHWTTQAALLQTRYGRPLFVY